MTRRRAALVAVLAAAAGAAIPATLWFLSSPEAPARSVAFENDGTGLASRNVNVVDLQLGRRGERGFAVLGVQGDSASVSEVLTELGPHFYEAHQIRLAGLEDRPFFGSSA